VADRPTRRLIAVAIGALLCLPTVLPTSGAQAAVSAGQPVAQPIVEPEPAPSRRPEAPRYADSVIVKFRTGASSGQQATVRRSQGLALIRRLGLIDAEVLRVPRGVSAALVARRLDSHPAVEYAAADQIRQPAAADPEFGKLWGLTNTAQAVPTQQGSSQKGKAGVDIGVRDAWKLTRGARSTIVAVLDTGVDITHPELAGAIWTNRGEIPGNGKDDDRNGYVDDVHGWDFVNKDNTVFDSPYDDDHGTHVAGTIAAAADNGKGVAGAAPGVTVMPLKFLGPDGGRDSDAIKAIEYAKAKGAKIINASWGGPGSSRLSKDDVALREAIRRSGLLFVAAAGNDGANVDATPYYPAAFDLPNVVSVAAVDNRGQLASFSNYGRKTIDIAAPGASILSTLPRRGADVAAAESTLRPAAWWGFGLEDVAGAARVPLLTTALTGLQGATKQPVTLVLDDSSRTAATTAAVWTKALTDAGYPFTTEKAGSTAVAPATIYQPGATLVWVTGDDYGVPEKGYGPLRAGDQSSLRNFVLGGGRLLLAGADALFMSEESALVTGVLHLHFLAESENRTTLTGAAGTPYAGMTVLLNGRKPVNGERDVVEVRPGGRALLRYPADGPERYGYMSGTSMAVPHVAAAAALTSTRVPSLTGAQLAERITTRRTPLSTIATRVRTGGIVSAAAASTGVPAAPTAVKATGGLRSVRVTWTAPKNTGGLPINGYEVTVTPGTFRAVVAAGARTATLSGLAANRNYTVTVRARNVGGLGSTAKASVKGSALSRTVSASKITYGAKVTHRLVLKATGSARGLAKQAVSLQHRRRGVGSWATACTRRTTSAGVASCAVKPSVTSEYRWVYAGSGLQVGAYSSAATVTVAAKVSAATNRTAMRRGTAVTISGTVAPQRAGKAVRLQQLSGKTWKSVGTAKLSKRSAYAFTIRPARAGSTRFRVVSSTDSLQHLGVSRTLTLQVR
jgi:subtilisin family serine protease